MDWWHITLVSISSLQQAETLTRNDWQKLITHNEVCRSVSQLHSPLTLEVLRQTWHKLTSLAELHEVLAWRDPCPPHYFPQWWQTWRALRNRAAEKPGQALSVKFGRNRTARWIHSLSDQPSESSRSETEKQQRGDLIEVPRWKKLQAHFR